MDKPGTEWDATSMLYGFIFLLYTVLAIVIAVWLYNRGGGMEL